MPTHSIVRAVVATASAAAMLSLPAAASALPSDLVAAFGDNGIASFDPRPGTVRSELTPTRVKALADGSTIVAGRTNEQDVFVAKMAPGGSLDTSFGAGGIRVFAPGTATYDEPYGLAIDSAGRIVVAGRMENDAFIARLTTGGALDASFDGDGVLPKTDGGGYGLFGDVETQGTAIYVVRSGYPSRIYRFTESGAADTGFGSGGESTAANNMNDTRLAIGPDGRITVGGSITGSDYRFFTLQGMADGAPGNYALAPVDLTGASYVGDFVDIAVDATGSIHMVGGGLADGYELIKTSSTGVQDYRVTAAAGAGGSDQPFALALIGGTVIVGGGTGSGAFLEGRSGLTGSPEGTFGVGGLRTIACVGAANCPVKALDVNGASIALAGDQADDTVLIGRLTATGSGDSAFSGDGFDVLERRSPWGLYVTDSAIASDGSIYLLGEVGAYGDESTFIAKQLPSGQLDPAWGAGGIIVSDLRPSSPEYSAAIVVDAAGRVYVSGGYASTTVEIWRFVPSGLDPSFGTAGMVAFALAGSNSAGGGAMALRDDSIVLGGYDVAGGSTYRSWFLRFSISAQAPASTFNGGAPRYIDQADGGNGEFVSQVLIRDDLSVVASGKSNTSPSVIKLTPGGTPDSGFGSSGVSTVGALGAVESGAGALVAVTASGKLIVATTVSDTSATKVGVARLTSEGSVDTTYGSGGVRYIGAGNGKTEIARSLLLGGSGEAIIGGEYETGIQTEALLARFTEAGAVDETFATGGFVQRDLSRVSGRDRIAKLHARGTEIHGVGDMTAAGGVGKAFVAAFGEPRPPAAGGPPPPAQTPTPVARKATSTIKKPKSKRALKRTQLRTIRGTASASGGTLKRVQVSIRKIEPRRCAWVTGKRATIKRSKTTGGRCTKPVWITASGTSTWSLKLRTALPTGRYEIRSRAVLTDGTTEKNTARAGKNVLVVTLK